MYLLLPIMLHSLLPKMLHHSCHFCCTHNYQKLCILNYRLQQEVDQERLKEAIRIANLESFIEELPLKAKTKIGASGNELSGGQRQRILIARAVYKKPPYLFLDEATSALDANNEKIIHDNLNDFFKGRTVVVIAHRLSTVKRADQIVVLKDGGIVEKGPHNELVHKKAEYYSLIKNQLELGA